MGLSILKWRLSWAKWDELVTLLISLVQDRIFFFFLTTDPGICIVLIGFIYAIIILGMDTNYPTSEVIWLILAHLVLWRRMNTPNVDTGLYLLKNYLWVAAYFNSPLLKSDTFGNSQSCNLSLDSIFRAIRETVCYYFAVIFCGRITF